MFVHIIAGAWKVYRSTADVQRTLSIPSLFAKKVTVLSKVSGFLCDTPATALIC
jgi:hypothetical protein